MLQKKFSDLLSCYGKELSYNEVNKAAFAKLGKAALSSLAKEMGFSEVRVSFNPGGIAVSGDHSLYGMFPDGTGVALYLLKGAFGKDAGYCRSIVSLKDHTGGRNIAVTLADLANVEALKAKLDYASQSGVL